MQKEIIKLIKEIEEKLQRLKELYLEMENESEHSLTSLFKYEKEKQEVRQELSELGRPFDYDKNNFYIGVVRSYQENYLIICLEGEGATLNGDYYLDTALEAQNAIDLIGEKRLKKYLFGMEC